MQSRTGSWVRWTALLRLAAVVVALVCLMTIPGPLRRLAAKTVSAPPLGMPQAGVSADLVIASSLSHTLVLNEVAWGGTRASAQHQWIELYNPSSTPISITGWSLLSLDGTLAFSLTGIIAGGEYFLLETSDDNPISDVRADAVYANLLTDAGEVLLLVDAVGQVVDCIDGKETGWPAGTSSPEACSMERGSPTSPEGFEVWSTSNGVIHNGVDAGGNPICGTPRQRNSSTYPVLPGDVRFNEVAWSGTDADNTHQWFELVNNTDAVIYLDAWQVAKADGAILLDLRGHIDPGDYFLVEAVESCVADVTADQVVAFTPLSVTGGSLSLVTDTLTIDTVNANGGL